MNEWMWRGTGGSRDERVAKRVEEHLAAAIKEFGEDRVVFIAVQGSQNYGLDTPQSDVDTKVMVLPEWRDIVLNNPLISTEHHMENDEHSNWVDVRKYLEILRKQNLNFMETLFSPYILINPWHYSAVAPLFDNREQVARYNPYKTMTVMKGVSDSYYQKAVPGHRMVVSPAMKELGYDPKYLANLLRIEDFIYMYSTGYNYQRCMVSENVGYIRNVKAGMLDKSDALLAAEVSYNNILEMTSECLETLGEEIKDEAVEAMMYEVADELLGRIVDNQGRYMPCAY